MHAFHIIDLRKRKSLTALYSTATLRFFALSFINIFLPIYLLKTHYSLETILVFYFVLYAVAGISSILAAKSLVNLGLRYTVAASSVFMVMFYTLILYSDIHYIPIYFLAVLAGLGEAFYFFPIHVEFSITAEKKHEGEEVSLLYEIPFIATILGPVIGGAIVYAFGFDALFAFAALLIFTSIIPLFWAKEIKRRHVFKMPEKANVDETIGIMSAGAREVGVFVFWPLFLFLIVKEFVAVGLVESISIFFAALVTLFIGNLSDNYGERRVLKWGSLANSLSWTLRVMATTLNQFIVIGAYVGASAMSLLIPLQSIIYKNAKKKNPIQYILFEQFMRAFGRVFLILLVFALGSNLYLGLVLCAFASLGCYLYAKNKT